MGVPELEAGEGGLLNSPSCTPHAHRRRPGIFFSNFCSELVLSWNLQKWSWLDLTPNTRSRTSIRLPEAIFFIFPLLIKHVSESDLTQFIYTFFKHSNPSVFDKFDLEKWFKLLLLDTLSYLLFSSLLFLEFPRRPHIFCMGIDESPSQGPQDLPTTPLTPPHRTLGAHKT